jgi:NADH:ubiquinone oxidoreductase subunit
MMRSPKAICRRRGFWEKDYVPNLTGTPSAYRPAGALERGGVRAAATGDYEAWTPEA